MEAEQNQYQSELGGDVVMGCRFQPGLSSSDMKVTWNWISSTPTREAYRLDNGVEQSASQDLVYRGRAALLREELEDGLARLKVPGPGPPSGLQRSAWRREPADCLLFISPDLWAQDRRLWDLPVPGPDGERGRLQGDPPVGHR